MIIFEVTGAEEGSYCATALGFGIHTQGETLAKAKANLLDAFQLSLEYLREKARKAESPQSVREPIELGTL